ncbi:MAG TPA: hypothetical protein DCS93_12110 [Microscillaceae bacterium]|nr:hypothetical protein [Microscillaceae bacterium]
MKKLAYSGLILVFSVIFLAACGGGNKNTEEKQDTTATTNDGQKGESTTNETAKNEGGTESSNDTTKDTTADKTNTEESTTKEEGKEGEKSATTFVEGTFTGLEQGDLFYFNVKDANGKDWSFTVRQTDATYEKVSNNEAAYKGKKVKVFYQKKKEYIENAGAEIEMLAYQKAEFQK